jgi:hypothetical protein
MSAKKESKTKTTKKESKTKVEKVEQKQVVKKVKKESFLPSFGNTDAWLLLTRKVSEYYTEEVYGMRIPKKGCLVKTTVFFGDKVSTDITFIADVRISESKNDKGEVIARTLIK